MELRERVAWARNRAKLTQKQLADHVGISRQAIKQWEDKDGTKSLDAANAIRAARALNVDPLWLATGEGEPISTGVQEAPASYDAGVPQDLLGAWSKLDPSVRRHVLAIILELGKQTKR